MLRLILIFAITFIMVMDAGAQDRRRGGGDGRGWDRGGGHSSHAARPGQRYYHAQRPGYRYRSGYGWYDPSAIIGGAIGGWLWRQWAQPEPPPEPVRDVAWCMNRYKSYDPYTRTYLGYDGLRHGCP
jgi:BA14K-like protein